MDIVVSFSGGRTSAYMPKWLKDNIGDSVNLHFVFANTGLEHPRTLDFVDRCDREWGLNLTWIEAVTHRQLNKGQTIKVVNYETASRNGEPYIQLASVEGIPCPTRPICTDRLKTVILTKFRNRLGRKAVSAVGIRVDEIDRMNPDAIKQRIIYPLVSMNPTTKDDVLDWFDKQPFGLEVPEHLGNCVTCWKKSDRKLMTIAKHDPDAFIPFKLIESKYSDILSKSDGKVPGTNRRIFRGHRTTDDIISASRGDFEEYVDGRFEQSNSDLDRQTGCESSCEPFSGEGV